MKVVATIWLLTIAFCGFGQSKVLQIPDSISHASDLTTILVTDYVDFCLDIQGEKSIDQMVSDQSGFRPLGNAILHPDSTYWFRLTLEEIHTEVQEYFLGFPTSETLEIYQESLEGSYIVAKGGPFTEPWKKDFVFDAYSFVRIQLLRENEKTIFWRYLPERVRNSKFNFPIPDIRNSHFFDSLIPRRAWKYTALAVIACCMLCYNLLLFGFTRERYFIPYLLFVLLISWVATSIHFSYYLLPQFYAAELRLIFLNLAAYFFIRFLILFLDFEQGPLFGRSIHKWIFGGTLIICLLYGIRILTRTLILNNVINYFSLIWCSIITLFAMWVTLRSLQLRVPGSQYLAVANGIFLFVFFAGLLLRLILGLENYHYGNWLAQREFIYGMLGVGVSSQVILFGSAIGYRIFRLEKDKSQAIQEKLETQENINLQLEDKVTERTAQLEHRNKENELLLGEIHHRVKNNLQVISSLLKLQSRQLNDGKAKSAVLEGRDRVKAMALIHQKLYQQDRFSAVEMHDYVQNLIDSLAQSYGYQEGDFVLNLEVPELYLDVDTAIPLGLIINELVSNAFKHAFDQNRSNQLTVILREESDKFLLLVADNGEGADLDRLRHSGSFGLELIEALAAELEGVVQYEKAQGTTIKVIFKHFTPMGRPELHHQ